jgi:formate dehydrogenase iron-sulfur subunit
VRYKPPLPAHQGLLGLPTLINNVLSLDAATTILAEGAARYRDFGSGRSLGTLTVQLAGNVKRGGLVEVPFGPTLRELVVGYGRHRQRPPAQAVQVGGRSAATCRRRCWTPLDARP